MDKFYCEYCGRDFRNVRQLTLAKCDRHPDGPNRGPHKLYEGSEKARYTCKYCGRQFPYFRSMVLAKCDHHPLGPNRGNHSPAL